MWGNEHQIKECREMEKILIEELDLSVRTYNALKRIGIDDIMTIKSLTKQDLRHVKGIGNATYNEIINTLNKLNISLKDEKDKKNGTFQIIIKYLERIDHEVKRINKKIDSKEIEFKRDGKINSYVARSERELKLFREIKELKQKLREAGIEVNP